jgi:hypothetical protein
MMRGLPAGQEGDDYVLHQAGAFFVTRAKSNLDAHRVYSAPTKRRVSSQWETTPT